jgi:hypothetical protein
MNFTHKKKAAKKADEKTTLCDGVHNYLVSLFLQGYKAPDSPGLNASEPMAYQAKTKTTEVDATDFLATVTNETRRADALAVMKLMQKVTRKRPRMWGPAIIGFDQYHYKYDSGHEGDICMIGLSPRAQALTLYVLHDYPQKDALLAQLGKHKTGKGCLYINKLSDVDMQVLEELIRAAYQWMKAKYA